MEKEIRLTGDVVFVDMPQASPVPTYPMLVKLPSVKLIEDELNPLGLLAVKKKEEVPEVVKLVRQFVQEELALLNLVSLGTSTCTIKVVL